MYCWGYFEKGEKMDSNYIYPEYVNIKEDGKIRKIPYRDIINHEKYIIEDNISYGYRKGYTEQG